MTGMTMTRVPAKAIDVSREAVEDFLFEEAARADAHDYAGWLELWAEDGTYYIPANDDHEDGRLHICLINEDYAAIQNRVQMQLEGFVHAQSPKHRLARTISNVRLSEGPDGLVEARAVINITAFRYERFDIFVGRVVYRLRPAGDSFKMVRKEIYLVNNDGHLPNMTFLL